MNMVKDRFVRKAEVVLLEIVGKKIIRIRWTAAEAVSEHLTPSAFSILQFAVPFSKFSRRFGFKHYWQTLI